MRRKIGIEALLQWAYRRELPKDQALEAGLAVGPAQFGQAWGGLERFGAHLTLVDLPHNRWGIVADLAARSEPHPDAIRVGQAVAALDDLVALPDDWNPLDDMAMAEAEGTTLLAAAVSRAVSAATVIEADGARRLKDTPRWLVMRHAVMVDDGPDWYGETPVVAVERHTNGTPKWFLREVIVGENGPYEIEVDGFQRTRRIPKPGAYQRRFLDPDPFDTVRQRINYQVWRAALDELTVALADLRDHEVVASERSWSPWSEGERAKAPVRILPDLSRPRAA